MREWLLGLLLFFCACRDHGAHANRGRLVFVHQPLGNAQPFDALMDRFRRAHPELEVVTQILPNASDVAHQYFLTSLEGGAGDLDVFVIDVVWVAEFARAGWIEDVSDVYSPERVRSEFFPGPAEAVTVDGRVYAVPWYLDVGLLYYRSDLVPRAPKTYAELESFALAAQRRDPSLRGYVWQGRQYEGLVCNVYEAIWGHGGEALSDRRLALQTPEAKAALTYLRGLLTSGISPASVTSFAEEDARQTFQSGKAVFMRNWPYAWSEGEREDSPIRGRFKVTSLPSVDGKPGPGALGGWQLALKANLPPERRAAALALVDHLTSPQANLELALAYGRNPPRPEVYENAQLLEKAPYVAQLAPLVRNSRPRPVTPYYSMLSDVLQSEFSAAVVGVREPAAALEWAQRRADALMGKAK